MPGWPPKNVDRRDLLVGSALSLLAGTSAFAERTATLADRAQQTDPSARLLAALRRNRLALTMGDTPTGPGWDRLVRESSAARFTLIGEEHGVVETAQFSTALFKALRESGYSRMAVELSPPIAEDVETAARRNGVKGVEDFLKNPDVFTFYNMREEAQFVADVIKAAPANERVLWGLDREIFSDRYLIARLEAKAPASARAALTRLKEASVNALKRFEQTKNPDHLFLLAEDPALVAAVRAAWPTPDRESDLVMRTLEESLAIEAAERAGGLWPYAQRRTQWMRRNFAGLLAADQGRTVRPKILLRFGYNHVIRGGNYVNVFDLGTMADEVAALTGEQAFHILVLKSTGLI
jgi:hypothetical protein